MAGQSWLRCAIRTCPVGSASADDDQLVDGRFHVVDAAHQRRQRIGFLAAVHAALEPDPAAPAFDPDAGRARVAAGFLDRLVHPRHDLAVVQVGVGQPAAAGQPAAGAALGALVRLGLHLRG
jgi:hypothetical protein